MKFKIAKLITIFLILICFKFPSAEAAESNKVVLLVVDYLKISDFYLSPALMELSKQSSIGLLNSNTGASRTIPHTYATVNAGRMVSAPRSGIQIYNGKEEINDIPALEIFKSKTGYNPPPDALVLLSLPQLLEQNKDIKSEKIIGHLGTQLSSAGLTTAVFGNADLPSIKDRTAALIGVNNLGYIPLGDVSEALNKKTNDFIGLRTNYEKLLESFNNVYKEADFIILVLGDLIRLERSQEEALPYRVLEERKKILDEIANFILEIKKNTNPERDLILAGSFSQNPQNSGGTNRLLPFLMFNNDLNSATILSSGTTKRSGVITNVDITATVLNHFGLPYVSTIGRPLFISSKDNNSIEYLASLNQRLSFIYDARNPLVKTYVLLQICILLAAVPVLIFLPKLVKMMKLLLLTLLCYPVSLLLLGFIKTNSILLYALISLVITTVIVFFSIKVTNNWLLSFMIIETITALVIIVDLLTGANLAKFSPLSYQVITGARYYGIGNEYMGVLIGSAIISSSIAYHLYPKPITKLLVTPFLIFTAICIALPQIGINFGGAVTATLAFGFVLLSMQGIRISFPKAVQLGTVCLLCVGLIIMYDSTQSVEAQSHLGRTALLIKEQGFIELWSIITRKVAMNIKLFRYTSWSRVFIASLLASTILLFRPINIFNTLKLEYPKLFFGILGTVIGSIIALIVNDSGIVASATMMIYSVLPLIYLAFDVRLQNSGTLKSRNNIY